MCVYGESEREKDIGSEMLPLSDKEPAISVAVCVCKRERESGRPSVSASFTALPCDAQAQK